MLHKAEVLSDVLAPLRGHAVDARTVDDNNDGVVLIVSARKGRLPASKMRDAADAAARLGLHGYVVGGRVVVSEGPYHKAPSETISYRGVALKKEKKEKKTVAKPIRISKKKDGGRSGRNRYSAMTVPELHAECKRRGLKNYCSSGGKRLKKADVVDLLVAKNIPAPNKANSIPGYKLSYTASVRRAALSKAVDDRGIDLVRARVQHVRNITGYRSGLTGEKARANRAKIDANRAKYDADLAWLDRQRGRK